jgi:Domain of unknown function (DUF1963)
MPDLPPGMSWPWRPSFAVFQDLKFKDFIFKDFKDHAARPWPLSFVAQIDFAEIKSARGLEGYPSLGRLLFFL